MKYILNDTSVVISYLFLFCVYFHISLLPLAQYLFVIFFSFPVIKLSLSLFLERCICIRTLFFSHFLRVSVDYTFFCLSLSIIPSSVCLCLCLWVSLSQFLIYSYFFYSLYLSHLLIYLSWFLLILILLYFRKISLKFWFNLFLHVLSTILHDTSFLRPGAHSL